MYMVIHLKYQFSLYFQQKGRFENIGNLAIKLIILTKKFIKIVQFVSEIIASPYLTLTQYVIYIYGSDVSSNSDYFMIGDDIFSLIEVHS